MNWRALDPVSEFYKKDRAYVVNTWARSASYRGLGLRDTYRLVDRMLDNPHVRVMCLVTGRTVHAWVAGELDGTLHYVYVPPELRGQGIARKAIVALLGSYPFRIECTHRWPLPDKRARFQFIPEALLREAA